MKTVIVLAMHGVPPADFPPQEMAEFFMLQGRLTRDFGPGRARILERHAEIESRMRNWPRNAQNDPFYAASREMAGALGKVTGCEVVLGFNEFCAPDLKQALEEAAGKGPERIVVVTPMMTRGGEHAETEIPRLLDGFRAAHTGIQVAYAWPFEADEVARFLAQHVARFAAE